MNYYERHIGDYMKDAAHLSLLEHGVYSRLLDAYYSREAAIPQDQAYRLVGAKSKDERAAVDAILTEFFKLTDGHWRQKRCDEVIEQHRSFIEKQRANGRASAAKRSHSQTPTVVDPPYQPNVNGGSTVGQPPTSHFPLPESKSGSAASGGEDPRKKIFDLGKQILGRSSGGMISNAIARTSEAKVGEVLGHMALSVKADPRAYFEAATATPEKRVAL